jgi:outer membrane receptor protein involved in Fe transport
VLAPNALIQGGVAFQTDLTANRVGGAFDGDDEVVKQLRVLYGAEAFHEWKVKDTPADREEQGNRADFIAPIDLTRLPVLCPRIYDAEKMSIVPVAGCPLTFAFEGSRTVFSAYANPQLRPNKKLILDAGVRASVAPEQLGSFGYPVNISAGGTIVYNFIQNWHAKLNYTQGFRPPVFNNTTPNGEAIVIGGDPDLKVETSDAMQAEINARIFKGERRIRELSFRADASYTRLNGLIQVATGAYGNSGERGLASGEFLGKLYIQGGHRFELGYTYLRGATSDRGLLKSIPEHWFNLASIFSLSPGKLTAMTNLKIMGATEDPNRLIEYRGSTYNPMTGDPMDVVSVLATDAVMDRLPPTAELQAGLTYTPTDKLTIRATVYNALNQHRYYSDAFLDYEPHLEYTPNPAPTFRAYLSAFFQY